MNLANPIVSIPFARRFGHVLLDAHVNGRPATLALDTGSGACGIDVDWGSEHGLLVGREAKAVGTDDVGIRLTTLESLRLADGVELRNEMAALVPLREVSAQHGLPIHGTVGFSFFTKFVVEIDYAGRMIRLHDPTSFVYDGPGERIPIELSKRVPILEAELSGRDGAPIAARLLLDIGTGGYGAVLTKPFVDRHSATLNAPPFIERRIGAGVGGAIHGRITMLGGIRLGKLVVKNPIAALPTTARGFFGVDWVDGTLGAPILSRTRLILDYPHNQVILAPAESLDAPFGYDLSGLSLRARGEGIGSVIIDEIVVGSAAESAGLRVGDHVRTVDRRTVSGALLDRIVEWMMVPGGKYVLGVERDGKSLDIEIRLAKASERLLG